MDGVKKTAKKTMNTLKYPYHLIRNVWLRRTVPLRKDTVGFVAHRGLSARAPENTIPAFKLAAENGFVCMETDIRRTKDGRLILIHDESLKRMCGVDVKVGDLTYEELQKIPVVGGKGQKNIPPAERPVTVPLLTDYLMICKNSNMIPMMELKDHWNVEEPLDEEYLEDIVREMKEIIGERPVVFVSFNLNSLLAMQRVLKNHGVKQATLYHLVRRVRELDFSWYKRQGIHLSIQGKANKIRDIRKVKQTGLKAVIWTVDDPDQARLYIRAGVDWVASNTKLWVEK